jgi:ABC-2 type transport system ATP-binding protein
MNVIEIDRLTKIYETRMRRGNITALDGVSLGVEQGEIFGLLGPNGAGKTSLLKVLLGITQATGGDVFIFGLRPSNPESRRKTGYLPENHRFPNHLTGQGLLEFTGRLFGLPQKVIDAQSDRILPLVGMDRWANTKIRKYSKGMMQRIGLAQALLPDPDILLLDEPTDGVDPVGKMEIRQVLQKVREEGKTIFLNSHLLSEVESVADRVAILSRGKVVRVDSVANLTRKQSQYQIEASIENNLVDVPAESGKVISVSSDGMLVEVPNFEGLNKIIDLLRLRGVLIKSVKPLTITLEQSFMEIVASGDAAEGEPRT